MCSSRTSLTTRCEEPAQSSKQPAFKPQCGVRTVQRLCSSVCERLEEFFFFFFVDCFSLKSSFFTVIVGMTSSSICSAAINTLSLTQHIWVKIFTAKSHLFAKLLTSQLLGNQWENERRKGTTRTLQLGGAPIDLLQESQSRLISDS